MVNLEEEERSLSYGGAPLPLKSVAGGRTAAYP